MIRSLAVVGTGLIGTSIALAAVQCDVTVYLLDQDPAAARTAAALGAGLRGFPVEPVDLAVLAVPPSCVGTVLREQQSVGLAVSYTDVTSVKSDTERAVLRDATDPARFVGGHPLAGRERSGPLAASADLFRDHPWVLTPTRLTSRIAYGHARALVTLCDAIPVLMDSTAHDDAVALVSHAPHVVASLMAARLRECSPDVSRLAGQGLRDVTRIADGDPQLWSEILQANAAATARVLEGLRGDLEMLLAALDDLASPDRANKHQRDRAVVDLLVRGTEGRTALHGARTVDRAQCSNVQVRVVDRPGEMARLLRVAERFGVRAADTTVTSDGYGFTVRMTVAPLAAEPLAANLRTNGWNAVLPDPYQGNCTGARLG